jgi:hypothetical protein
MQLFNSPHFLCCIQTPTPGNETQKHGRRIGPITVTAKSYEYFVLIQDCDCSDSSEAVDFGLLGFDVVWKCRQIPTFQRNILPTSAGMKSLQPCRWIRCVHLKRWNRLIHTVLQPTRLTLTYLKHRKFSISVVGSV